MENMTGKRNNQVSLHQTRSGVRYRLKQIHDSEKFNGYLFIAPLVLGVLIFSILPILFAFAMSFTDWNSLSAPQIVGTLNYSKLLQDPNLGIELRNTLLYTIGTVPVTLILAVLIANALNQKIPCRGLFRTIYFLPVVTMQVAVAMVWRWLLNSQFGVVNQVLAWFGIEGPMWLGDSNFIMIAVIIVTVWNKLGYNTIILLAGLQGISDSYYEAADIEGISAVKKFTKITLPLLSPSIFFVSITLTMDALKAFDIIYIFTGSGADSSSSPMLKAIRTMVYGIYENGFINMKMGYACAEAVILFCIIMAITALQFYMQKKWVYYD